jgi:hypothetical protein
MTRCDKHGTTIIEGICNHCDYTKYTKPKTTKKKGAF